MERNRGYKDGDFTCDKSSKDYFISTTTSYINDKYPKWEVSWFGADGVYEGDELVDFKKTELGKESSTSNLDLIMELGLGGTTVSYAIELKERWNPYVSTYYGEEGKEGWIYNSEKDSFLRLASGNGYVPLYANVYPDKVVRVWNIDKISKDSIGEVDKNIKKHNVVDGSPRIKQHRLTLMNKDGVTYGG